MTVSYCVSGLLSPSLPISYRSRNCASGDRINLAYPRTDCARRMSCTLITAAGRRESVFSALALFDGSEGSESLPWTGAPLKSGIETVKRRKTGLLASSSSSSSVSYTPEPARDQDDGGNGFSGGGSGKGGGGGDGGHDGFGESESSGSGPGGSAHGVGILASFLRGWDARVKADPQFAFKVLMEEVVGVGACVLGDMATRPNFGLDELDLVFSTLVVGSILNFTLMYMLAPTAAAGAVAQKLPGIFASSPAGHMFEAGAYSLVDRVGTFIYKGTQFATVGFFAGIVGTGLSTMLINARKKVDPNFVSQNASPPILLNAATWAIHMGISSNGRYQTLNGLEFALAKVFSPGPFKVSVTVLRALNNVLGGTSFVALARLTGSQPREPTAPPKNSEGKSTSLEPAIASS